MERGESNHCDEAPDYHKNICVVGLSDLGRSPRFQFHCISLAEEGYNVDVICYGGTQPKKELLSKKNVQIKYLPNVPKFEECLPKLLSYAFKVIWQCVTLFLLLLCKRRSTHVLVEIPPALPSLAVCWLYCLLASSSFIIDWHNYSYSILSLTLGAGSSLVKISYWFECFFGRRAHANLCVTKAMKMDLSHRWGIESRVLYDKPGSEFKPTSLQDKHQLFTKLSQRYPVLGGGEDSTAFTRLENGEVKLRGDRPAFLVSSTSYTEDEDFNILLSALIDYDKSAREDLPSLICAITGKGPLKEHYIGIIQATRWTRVTIITPWLEAEDYPILLGSADLGVSLHTSSSGLDLPMKVVDMFGCGLPVLAHNFNCVGELVKHEENGLIFNDANELSSQLMSWFTAFPKTNPTHSTYSKAINAFRNVKWHQNWTLNALPVFN